MPEADAKMTHSDTRRKAAEKLAEKLHRDFLSMEPDSLPPGKVIEFFADHFEEALIYGEKAGVQDSVAVLDEIVRQHRSKLTFGVANHVESARATLQKWFIHDPAGNFKKANRPKVLEV